MRLSELQDRLLKSCFDRSRETNNIIGLFDQKYHYQPQTIRNALTMLYTYGYIERHRKGKCFWYKTSDKGKNVLEGKEIVQEIVSRSSNDSGQMMLISFTRR